MPGSITLLARMPCSVVHGPVNSNDVSSCTTFMIQWGRGVYCGQTAENGNGEVRYGKGLVSG